MLFATGALILCLAMAGQTSMAEKSSSMSDLELHTEFVVCDEKDHHCVHCFQEKANGEVYMHAFEFTAHPVIKYEISLFMGNVDRKLYVIRNDTKAPFRTCFQHSWMPNPQDDFKLNLCMDNDFSRDGITVPSDCKYPIAVVSFDVHRTDDKLQGQRILYCKASAKLG